MTNQELKLIIERKINNFMYRCGAVGNSHLSQCDFDEVARPVATLAVLSGLRSYTMHALSAYSRCMRAYLDALSFIVRIGGSYEEDMREVIYDYYQEILVVIRDDDCLTNFDLIEVLDELYEEAKQ